MGWRGAICHRTAKRRRLRQPRAAGRAWQHGRAVGLGGVFIWDHVAYREPGWPVADPQVAVAALAATTKHVRLGVLMVALPRRRPWKVARELASLDVLSGGRAIFGAGLGSQALQEYEAFGEQGDAKVRAERLGEALEIVVGLWSGAPF